MRQFPKFRTISVLVSIALAGMAVVGCRLLHQTPPALPSETPKDSGHLASGQLVIHSDFRIPSEHRLLREITSEREVVAEVLKLPPCEEPIHIHLFHDGDTFADYLRKNFPSMPHRRAFFVETDTRLIVYAHWSDHVAEDLRHEAAHGYLHGSVGNLPLWLDEGLAEYFEVPRGQHGLNQPHVELLAGMLENDWQPDLKRLTELNDFAAMTQQDYAEAWAWVHYLLESSPAERELLQTYLANLRRDGTAEPIFRRLKKLRHAPEQNFVEHLSALNAAQE